MPDQESSNSEEEELFYEECDDDDFVRVEHISVVSGFVTRNSMINGIQRLFGLRGYINERIIDDGISEGYLPPPLYSTGTEEQLIQTKTNHGSFLRNFETKSLKGSKGTSYEKSEFFTGDHKLYFKDVCCYILGTILSLQPIVIGFFLFAIETHNVCIV